MKQPYIDIFMRAYSEFADMPVDNRTLCLATDRFKKLCAEHFPDRTYKTVCDRTNHPPSSTLTVDLFSYGADGNIGIESINAKTYGLWRESK